MIRLKTILNNKNNISYFPQSYYSPDYVQNERERIQVNNQLKQKLSSYKPINMRTYAVE